MQALAEQAWTPWIAVLVLGAGAVLLLAMGLAPLRALTRVLRARRERHDAGPRPPFGSSEATAAPAERTTGLVDRAPLLLALAAASGTSGIAGGALAVATGGPGALVWMWIATLAGMAIVFAEASLSARARDVDEPPSVHLLAAPRLGRLLAPMYAVAVLVAAVLVGGALQTHQTAAMLGATNVGTPSAVAIGLAVAAIPLVLMPKLRRPFLLAVPVAVLVYAALALWVAASAEVPLVLQLGDAVNAAFGVAPAVGGAVGGGVALAVGHGVLRATLAGHAGLGTVALLDLRARNRGLAGVAAMVVPLIASGVLGSASALLVLAAPVTDEPVTDPDLPMPVPLEVIHGDGLRPSQQVGQTIVLSEGSAMEVGKHYGMKLRSDPRGHALAKLVEDQNHVALPHWAIAHASDTIVLRGLGKDRRTKASWDVRIPCEREVKQTPDGFEYLLLRPKDPEIQLKALATKLELLSQPYVVFDDFSFPGLVGRATSPDLGEHVAMYETPNTEHPFNPKLHEFFRTGYRGPYADDDGPRPPWGFIAREGWQPAIGSKVALRIVGDPRGNPVLHTTRSGSLEAPAWDLLLQAKTVVLRHESDPSKDMRVPVTPRYELYRVRFTVDDERFVDDRGALKSFQGYDKEPYLVVPDYEFEAEVHGDTRLRPTMEATQDDGTTKQVALAGRRTLVPLHPLGEPQGPHGEEGTYRPHPAELLEFGMRGPLLPVQEGAALAAARMQPTLGGGARAVLMVVLFVLAVSSIVAWIELGGRAATAVLGRFGPVVLGVAVLAAAALSTRWTLSQLLPAVDLSLAAVLVPNLLGMLLLWPRVRAAARVEDDRVAPEPSPDA